MFMRRNKLTLSHPPVQRDKLAFPHPLGVSPKRLCKKWSKLRLEMPCSDSFTIFNKSSIVELM